MKLRSEGGRPGTWGEFSLHYLHVLNATPQRIYTEEGDYSGGWLQACFLRLLVGPPQTLHTFLVGLRPDSELIIQ